MGRLEPSSEQRRQIGGPMADAPTVSRYELETTDPELGHQWVREAYAEHAPRLGGDPRGFRLRIDGVAMDRFRIDHVVHTMSVFARVEPYGGLFVNRVRGGGFSFGLPGEDHRSARHDLTLLDTRRAGTCAWELLDVDMVGIDLGAVRRIAAELSGLPEEQIHFSLAAQLDAARARLWSSTLDHALALLTAEDVEVPALLGAELLRSLVVATLVTFPNSAMHTWEECPPARMPGVASGVVRRATAFIDANAHRDIGLTEIAAAAHIGPRGLQHAFRRHLGTGPLQYLRRARLDCAHRDLLAAEPDGPVTVARVAATWGFGNPGRFAVAYREAYGCLPSETLRR